MSDPCGNRTRLTNVRGWRPEPIDERAILFSSAPGRSRTCKARRRVGYSHLSLPMLGHGTVNQGGSRGTRTHKRLMAATCLPSKFLIRPDGFRRQRHQKVPGVGIEPTTSCDHRCASVPGVRRHYQQQLPRIVHRSDTTAVPEVRGEGVEPPSPGSKPGGLPLADPRSRHQQEKVPCGSRTRLASLEGWHLCRSAKGT